MTKIGTLNDLNQVRERGLAALIPSKIKIMVGMATSGIASGAQDVYNVLDMETKKRKLDIILSKTGSMGMDCMEPLVDVMEPGKPRLSYSKMTVTKVPALLDQIARGTIEAIKPFYRMGPFRIMDLSGVDLIHEIFQGHFEDTGDPNEAPPQFVADLVKAGKLGRKTGQGFYDYGAE